MPWRKLVRNAALLAVPVVFLTGGQEKEAVQDCSRDLAVETGARNDAAWSSLGGKVSFHEDGEGPWVRLTFKADPAYLRFDQDASLRGRVDFSCAQAERPLAIDFEVRFSRVLEAAAELNDVMLLGQSTRMLRGAGVPAPGAWVPVRILVPSDSPPFHALHFGAGSAWARERPGETVTMDLRRLRLERREFVYPGGQSAQLAAGWRTPDDPRREDAGPLVIAPGAPVLAVVDFPGRAAGSLRLRLPPGIKAQIWTADWLPIEQKTGVVEDAGIRLLPYREGSHLPGDATHPRRFWIRLLARTGATGGALHASFGETKLTRDLEVVPVDVPAPRARFMMYYQMNENWPAYAKYAAFYRNAPAHIAQLRELGFTGIHIAEEPRFGWAKGRLTSDFTTPGRYWQRWPLSLSQLAGALKRGQLDAPLVWEGLRIFTRDDVWAGLQPACACNAAPPGEQGIQRLVHLASAAAPGWKSLGERPFLSIADEPGVHSEAEVAEAGTRLQTLRAHGYRTFLTTHARMYDSFHRLAPFLDINALHAEDVTAGAYLVPRRYGGRLWLYNGGSFNVTPPGNDRFFAGLYAWLAGAEGAAQWIYTRPGELNDALELQKRLSSDAQFYALPGHGDQPAATPGLLGLSAGIADRAVLELAQERAGTAPEIAAALADLRQALQLPEQPSEYTPAHLRTKADLPAIREKLLRLLAASTRP